MTDISGRPAYAIVDLVTRDGVMTPEAKHHAAIEVRERLAQLLTDTVTARVKAPSGSPERSKCRAAGVQFERALKLVDKGIMKL